jgi:hypothetical protein
MSTVTKVCRRCNRALDIQDFYKVSQTNYSLSECKSCMKERSKARRVTNEDYQVSVVESERLAIEYLAVNGIPALPGKALRKSFVDVIVFGCVGIEVKFAKLEDVYGTPKFNFKTTPSQQKFGFRADVVCLICDYDNRTTFHFFPAKHPVFYMKGRLKTGLTFTPGAYEALKHGENRVVMVQGMMDEAQDRIELIYGALQQHVAMLKDNANQIVNENATR